MVVFPDASRPTIRILTSRFWKSRFLNLDITAPMLRYARNIKMAKISVQVHQILVLQEKVRPTEKKTKKTKQKHQFRGRWHERYLVFQVNIRPKTSTGKGKKRIDSLGRKEIKAFVSPSSAFVCQSKWTYLNW